MLALLILAACEGTTTDPENLPAWEVFSNNSENPTSDGGTIQFQPGAGILLDGAMVASGWTLDIMSEQQAVLWAWAQDEGGEVYECVDCVTATAEGFELTICDEPVTLLAGE